MSEGRRVTSTDVARAAGLSRATVSYVLNGEARRIPPETRQRVLDAAESLGYKPFAPARLLRGARSKLVLMVSPGLESAADAVAASIISSLGDKLTDAGYHLVWQLGLSAVGRTATDLAPAVVLVAPTEQEAAFDELRRKFAVPVMPAFPGLDGFLGASALAQIDHLAELGHRRVAYARPAAVEFDFTADIRVHAAAARAAELGLEPLAITHVPADRAAASVALEALVRDGVTALAAYNDHVAFVMLSAAYDLGIAVPGELSVVGVDDDAVGLLTVPSLTTVTADLEPFVEAMAAQVVGIASGDTDVDPARLPASARVVPRASTAAPAPARV